jgi:hypothetical protein
MSKSTDQNVIDNKIHNFMARKSLWKTFSKTIGEYLSPSQRAKITSNDSDISYEPLDWNHSDAVTNGRWQKAH